MSYAGFTRPAWAWLRGDALPAEAAGQFLGLPVPMPRLSGEAVVNTMRRFRAGLPWHAALHSWAILDSHDTARFRTIAGSRERHVVGVGLQMTTPGVPMVFAGDEIGLEGDWGEDARRTMPWSHPQSWDTELLEAYRGLIALRRSKLERLPAAGSAGRTCPPTPSRTSAKPRARPCCAWPPRAPHEPVRLPLAAAPEAASWKTLFR